MKVPAAALFLAVGLQRTEGTDGNYGNELTPEDHRKHSVCTVSALAFGPPLAKLGLHIDHIVEDCTPPHSNGYSGFHGEMDERACAVDVLDVIEMCSWVAAYMVATINTCTGVAEEKAECTNSITELVSATIGAAAVSGRIAGSCPAATSGKWPSEDEKKPHVGDCVIDSFEAAWSLARVGILINSAVVTCGEGGNVNQCTANVHGVVQSFVIAAHFVTAAVNDCGYGYDFGLACASDVLALTAVVQQIAISATGIHNHCVVNKGLEVDATRRLLTNGTGDASMHRSLNEYELAYLKKLNITQDEMIADPRRVILAIKKQANVTSTDTLTNSVVV